MKTIISMILGNYKAVLIFLLLTTTIISCKILMPKAAEAARLKQQIEAQTKIINHQNELIKTLLLRPTTQIKNDIKIGKKSIIENFNPEITTTHE